MPELTITHEIREEIDVEFEVYCATCGFGLCSYTSTDSRNMKVEVEACPGCMEIMGNEIAKLEERINNLEEELEEAQDEITSLENTIIELNE